MDGIRVTSYNLRVKCDERDPDNNWMNRIPRIVKQISLLQPDLIGAQELRLSQYEQIKDLLTDYESEFCPRDGERGEGTPIFYRKDRFVKRTSGSYYLNEHPDTPGIGWDAACLRVATYVNLQDKRTGKTFTYFNTHLDHVGTVAQVEGIKLMVERMKKNGGSMILSGDFNVPEFSSTYDVAARLLKDCKFAAKRTQKGNTFHDYGEIPYDESLSPIDYIFVSGDVSVQTYRISNQKIDGGWSSDHFAISADICLK